GNLVYLKKLSTVFEAMKAGRLQCCMLSLKYQHCFSHPLQYFQQHHPDWGIMAVDYSCLYLLTPPSLGPPPPHTLRQQLLAQVTEYTHLFISRAESLSPLDILSLLPIVSIAPS